MNFVRPTRTASLDRCTQLNSTIPCLRTRRLLFAATFGRLRQCPTAQARAGPDSALTSGHNAAAFDPRKLLDTVQWLREEPVWRNPSNSHAETVGPSVAGALLRLWRMLTGCLATAFRLLALAAVFCLAALLPRPAASHAAAAGAATVAAARATSSTDSSSSSSNSRAHRQIHNDGDTCSSHATCGAAAGSSSTSSNCSGGGPGHHAVRPAAEPPPPPPACSGGATSRTQPSQHLPATTVTTTTTSTTTTTRGNFAPFAAVTFSPGPLAPAAHPPPPPPPPSTAASSSSSRSGDPPAWGPTAAAAATPALRGEVPAAAAGDARPAVGIAGGGAAVLTAPSSGGPSGATPAAGSAGAGPAAAAAAGSGPLVDPETAALSAQLGLGAGEAGVVRMFERHRASVVNISGMRAMQSFTTLDLGKMPYGQGSGFLWGEKGHVVTCYHLVKGAAEVKVTLYDNTSYTAKVIGYDAAKNVAVLKLSVPKSKLRELQPVTPGSAASLRVGQNVYGIGNPWGLGHTLSRGLVCGLGLELSAGLFPIKGVILTDCAADPGSSGGALLDSQGALVGMMVTPPASSGGGGGGGGGRSFAVPIDAVRGLINQILAYGRTTRPALGITMAPAQVLERVGLEGVLVLEVPPGSPSHAAGLRPTHRDIFGDLVLGDVIVGLDGKLVRSSSDVYDILDEHRVGDRVKLDVVRDGKTTGLTVTLTERLLGSVEE